MEEVTDENGHIVTKQADIMKVQKDFFSNLYQKKINSDEIEEKIIPFMRNTVTPTISVTQKDKYKGVLVETELLCALKQIVNGSAPGCDGITVEFLKCSGHRLELEHSTSVVYCGWISEYFAVVTGIRQGCPFSPLAFVLAVELLAIKNKTF